MRLSSPLAALATLAAAALPAAYAQIAMASGMTADSYCNSGGQFCVTGVYVPSAQAVNYTVVVQKAGNTPYGWTGVGVGSGMAGANMVIGWVNGPGSATISHRSASGEVMPTEARVATNNLPAFTANSQTTTTAEYSVYSWLFPASSAPSGTVSHIYGYAGSNKAPSSSDSGATLRQHDTYGYFSLDMSKAYDGTAPAGLPNVAATTPSSTDSNGSSSGSAGYGQRNRDLSQMTTVVYLVHMIFMVVGLIVIAPLGILVARYGRTLFKWFPTHAGLQLFVVVLVIVGFALSVHNVMAQDKDSFSLLHHQLGLAIFILVIFQALMGALSHIIVRRTGFRYLGYFHALTGVVIFGLAVWNAHEGFELWTWQPPAYASYIIYAWAGVVALIYVIGFMFLPRERRQHKEWLANRNGGGSNQSLTHEKTPPHVA